MGVKGDEDVDLKTYREIPKIAPPNISSPGLVLGKLPSNTK